MNPVKRPLALASLTLLIFSGLGGCAMQPSQEQLSQLPVIEFGNPVTVDGEYILYFPAGKDIPTDVRIEGDIFEAASAEVLKVRLKRDIYSYKDWMSYDKQTWLYARDHLGLKFDIKIPGYTYPQSGHIVATFFEKEK